MRKLSVDDLWYAEVQFNEKSQTAKRNFVLEFLHDHSQINDSGEYETEFFVRGKSVCREAIGYWLTISIKNHSEEFTTNSKMVC